MQRLSIDESQRFSSGTKNVRHNFKDLGSYELRKLENVLYSLFETGRAIFSLILRCLDIGCKLGNPMFWNEFFAIWGRS